MGQLLSKRSKLPAYHAGCHSVGDSCLISQPFALNDNRSTVLIVCGNKRVISVKSAKEIIGQNKYNVKIWFYISDDINPIPDDVTFICDNRNNRENIIIELINSKYIVKKFLVLAKTKFYISNEKINDEGITIRTIDKNIKMKYNISCLYVSG